MKQNSLVRLELGKAEFHAKLKRYGRCVQEQVFSVVHHANRVAVMEIGVVLLMWVTNEVKISHRRNTNRFLHAEV